MEAGDLARALSVTPPDARKAAKVRGKLLRYLIRMSTRPTPYGMFAGVALSEFGEETDLRLADKPPRVGHDRTWRGCSGWSALGEARPEVRAQLNPVGEPSGIVHNGRF